MANVVVTGKTIEPHRSCPARSSLPRRIERAGGQSLAVAMDVREEPQVKAAVKAAVARFGGIDVLVNNASAIYLTGTLATPVRRFDLMHQVNTRGTFLATQHCLPHLLQAANPHVLNIAPPLNLNPRWFAPHVAYTMAKYGMSLCVLGMAEEFRADGVAVNALWPRTAIGTAAITSSLAKRASAPHAQRRSWRTPAHAILTARAATAPAASSSTTRCLPRQA
jgi:citronellol/citronellal dehydrogenase